MIENRLGLVKERPLQDGGAREEGGDLHYSFAM